MTICLTMGVRPNRPNGLPALLLALFIPGTLFAGPVTDGLRTRIEQSYQARDLGGIEVARAELLDLAAAEDRDTRNGAAAATGAAYYAAYARFRQALAADSDRRKARDYLEDCITELVSVVEQTPAHAEARALLGSCYGMSTQHSALATVTRGLEARKQMAEARRLAPDNPWVVMQDGLADWATPRLFGGDRKLGVEKLERAAALFIEAMANGSQAAAWGASEAFEQLGLRYRILGQADAAESALSRAASLSTRRLQLAAAGRP